MKKGDRLQQDLNIWRVVLVDSLLQCCQGMVGVVKLIDIVVVFEVVVVDAALQRCVNCFIYFLFSFIIFLCRM